MAKNGELTGKQAKFVQEYLVDMNATQAAIRAGYSVKSAHYMGFDTLRNHKVQEALTIARQAISAQTGITPEKVIEARGQLAFFDLADCYDEHGNLKNIHDIPKAARLALSGIDVDEIYAGQGGDRVKIGTTKKVRTYDKTKSLEALEKHFGLYNADTSQKGELVFRVVYENKPVCEEENDK